MESRTPLGRFNCADVCSRRDSGGELAALDLWTFDALGAFRAAPRPNLAWLAWVHGQDSVAFALDCMDDTLKVSVTLPLHYRYMTVA